jgi:hypothetical protein
MGLSIKTLFKLFELIKTILKSSLESKKIKNGNGHASNLKPKIVILIIATLF